MKIHNYRPGRPGARTRAYMDIRLDDGIFIREVRLVETRNGVRVYGPVVGDRTLVAFPPAVADSIAKAVADVAA